MSFWEKIFGTITGKIAETKGEAIVTEFVDTHYKDKQLKERERNFLLDRYGNELFYHAFDSYMSNNDVLANLIDAVRGKTSLQPNNKTEFVAKNLDAFLAQNTEYLQKPVIISKVTKVFKTIFDHIFSEINQINPHTDIGKMQNDLHRIEAENRLYNEGTATTLQGMSKKIEEACAAIVSQTCISGEAKQDWDNCSTEIERFNERIKEIETQYQEKNLFQDAIQKYVELFQSITGMLLGQPQAQIDTLVCTLNCNLAICYSNLNEINKAYHSLSLIPVEAADTSKSYHFVNAIIVVQHLDTENYSKAKGHIDRALELDLEYHSAFMLGQYLLALMKAVDMSANIAEYNQRFQSVLSEDKDRKLISNFYMNRGLIYQAYDDPESAMSDFERSKEYGYDAVIVKFNIAVALYGQACSGLPKDRRVLFAEVHCSPLLRAIKILKEIILEDSNHQTYCVIKERAIPTYVSACGLLGIHHGLSPIKEFLHPDFEYETIRTLLLGTDERLSEKEMLLLDEKDRFCVVVQKYLDDNKLAECKALIVEQIASGGAILSLPIYSILLQICLELNTPNEYWRYKDVALSHGVCGVPVTAMDACAYELGGKIAEAKTIFDDMASHITDYFNLKNILKFYARNSFTEEYKALFIRIFDLWKQEGIYVGDLDALFGAAMNFFVEQKSTFAIEILAIATGSVSPSCYDRLQATVSSAINDVRLFGDSLSRIYLESNQFQDGFNHALCLCWSFRYDEALEVSFALLERVVDTAEKVKLYWFISDLFLLKKQHDESYEWAQKAHDFTSQNPYEESHQAFLARSLRAGHQEGLATVIKYKSTHPVVVDWIEAISFNKEELETDPAGTLMRHLKERFPDMENAVKREKSIADLYRKGNVPMNLVLQYYEGAWWQLFRFAAENKLSISHGNQELLKQEQDCVSDALVVDAQTLVLMAYFGCLAILQEIEHVYINYGSIATLQHCYLSWDFPFITELMDWIVSAPNIVFEPDGYIIEEDIISKVFSRDFIAGCNIASKKGTPFLFCDYVARKYEAVSGIGLPEGIQFVSIPAMCYTINDQPELLHGMLYNLLKGCEFVSFTAETMLCQIRKQNYQVTRTEMEPFLICRSAYDMESFASVYLQAVYQLKTENEDAAVALAEIILSDALRIWRRGTYYRITAQRFSDVEAESNALHIMYYVKRILFGIDTIFPTRPKAFVDAYSMLQDLIN